MKVTCNICSKEFKSSDYDNCDDYDIEHAICDACNQKNFYQEASCVRTIDDEQLTIDVHESRSHESFDIDPDIYDVKIIPVYWDGYPNDKEYHYLEVGLDLEEVNQFLDELMAGYKTEAIVNDCEYQSRKWVKKLYKGYKGFIATECDDIRTDKIGKSDTRDVWIQTITLSSKELGIEKEFIREGSMEKYQDRWLEIQALEMAWDWLSTAETIFRDDSERV
jgi:hypothetical protein